MIGQEWKFRHKFADSIASILYGAAVLRACEPAPETRGMADAIVKSAGCLRRDLEAALGYPTVEDVMLLAQKMDAKAKGGVAGRTKADEAPKPPSPCASVVRALLLDTED